MGGGRQRGPCSPARQRPRHSPRAVEDAHRHHLGLFRHADLQADRRPRHVRACGQAAGIARQGEGQAQRWAGAACRWMPAACARQQQQASLYPPWPSQSSAEASSSTKSNPAGAVEEGEGKRSAVSNQSDGKSKRVGSRSASRSPSAATPPCEARKRDPSALRNSWWEGRMPLSTT